MGFYRQPDLQSQHPPGFSLSRSCGFAQSLSRGLLLCGTAMTCPRRGDGAGVCGLWWRGVGWRAAGGGELL